jgi:hypothetical protein
MSPRSTTWPWRGFSPSAWAGPMAALEKALRRIADGIAGGERRAHVILSGRLTDWEFRRDRGRLNEDLAVPKDPVLPPPLTEEQVLTSALRHRRPKPSAVPTENPLVVLMVPLDPDRVRVFAAANGAPNLDASPLSRSPSVESAAPRLLCVVASREPRDRKAHMNNIKCQLTFIYSQ